MRLFLVLTAASAVCACSQDEATPTGEPTPDAGSSGGGNGSLVSAAATATTTATDSSAGGAGVHESRRAQAPGDGPVDEVEEALRLTRALLALNIEDEGAINRTLLRFGAGASVRDDERAHRVFETLRTLAQNERAGVRRGALALLGRMPLGRIVGDPFVPAMLDPDAGVRRQAVIGRTRHGVAKHWLQLASLANDTDACVRVAVVQGLAFVDQQEARGVVVKLLNDRDDSVVAAAASALAAMDVSETPPAVFEASRSTRPVVRNAAAVVLAQGRTSAALRQLVAMAGDDSTSVRKEAVWAMSGFAGDLAAEALVAVESIAYDAGRGRAERFESLQGLARTENVPHLDKLFAVAEKDKESVLRLVAARTLVLRGDVRATKLLVDLLETKPVEGVVDGDEDAAFVRHTAETVLCDVVGVAVGSRPVREWRRMLPDVEARLAKGPSDVPPQRIAQRW